MLLLWWITPLAHAAEGITYKVNITGVKDRELLQAIENSSDTVSYKGKPIDSLVLLRLRVTNDIKNFRQLLDSLGFYDATLQSTIDDKASPVMVTFAVQPGKAFVFAPTNFTIDPLTSALKPPTAATLGIKEGEVAEAKKILAAKDKLLHFMNMQGFPFAKVEINDVLVNYATATVAVSFTLLPGVHGAFGATTIKGLETVKEDFLTRKIPWKQGEPYTISLIEKYEKTLNNTGLFVIVTIEKGEELDEKGQLPITVTVKERLHRTVKTGVNYQSDEGPGVLLSWQNRNIFHRGEQVDININISAVTRSINNTYTHHDFLRSEQTLKIFYDLINEDSDAYFTNSATIGTTIERKLSEPLTVGAGVNYKLSHVKQVNENGDFGLISTPVFAVYDTRDNKLDPVHGTNSSIQFTPSFNVLDGNANFTKEYISSSYYFPMPYTEKVSVASRAAVGFIQSPSTENVPPNERFYAGGSGSVRGYGYQTLSPYSEGSPFGGRSLAEISTELRFKLSPKYGIVTFLDGGNSYDAVVPDIRDIEFGTGIGFRYYTSFAPVRFDIGVPLNGDQTALKKMQFYISLGQAF